MILKSEAIKNFLSAASHPDLSALYHKGMECQVLVAKDDGVSTDIGKLGGKPVMAYTKDGETWKSFRIPWKAMSEPEDNDGPIKYNLEKHVEGIGLTGWDWQNKVSKWVAYDFDSMLGHSDKHQKKLTDAELLKVQEIVTGLPYVTIRKSTSGRGLHLYIFLDNVATANHTEHAALARSILSMIAGNTGYNFTDKVDICGGNMWVWHRKMLGTDGLKLVRQGDVLKNIPANWKDHAPVINKSTKRISVKNAYLPSDIGFQEDVFMELSGQRAKVRLDDDHKKLIQWLEDKGLRGWWDADNHMLVTHTAYLRDAHKDLKMRGEFYTMAQGSTYGDDINCFCFPCRNGVWAVRKFGVGGNEHPFWVCDKNKHTRCYFNRELTLDDAARLLGAIELEGGGYQFPTCQSGQDALLKIKVEANLPIWIMGRTGMKIKEARNEYKIVVVIPKEATDNAGDMKDWLPDKNTYRRLFNNPSAGIPDEAIALGDYDNTVRHIISEGGEDLGWVIATDHGSWRHEPVNHVTMLLGAQGIGSKDIKLILGRCVAQPWIIVNKPFEPEYPGDRQWNRSKARFRIAPSTDGELLSFPTWQKVLDHCGKSLDSVMADHPWCKENGIKTGGQYLLLWFACLVKYPQQPLPYLGLHGPQDSGKSTIHEAFCQYILAGGFMDGKTALTSQSNFNGELQDTILVTLEEMDLRKRDVEAKMKEWVTSPTLTIHIKGQTPYKAPNFTHYIQCVNDRNYIPVFPGDKRVTMLYVESLSPEDMIPRRDLWAALQKEAPDFLSALLNADIPDSRDRLMIPVIASADKQAAEFEAMNPVEKFFALKVETVPGHYESSEDVYNTFVAWLADSGERWSKNKFGSMVPSNVPRGRISATKTQNTFYGNIWLKSEGKEKPAPSIPWTQTGGGGGVSLTRKHQPVEVAAPAQVAA